MTSAQNWLLLKAYQSGGILRWTDLTPGENRTKNSLIKSGYLEACGYKDARITEKGAEALKSFY